MGGRIEYRRLRAPSQDNQALILPPLSAAAELVSANRESAAGHLLWGVPLGELQARARGDLLRSARHHSEQYRAIDLRAAAHGQSVSPPRVIVSGHQPELFHPGVWFKNFALSALGQSLAAVPVNLVIDSDTVTVPQIRIPQLRADGLHTAYLGYDEAGAALPWEERSIRVPALFAAFGARVKEAIGPWIDNPCVAELWPLACHAAHRGRPLGLCLAEARHALEERIGLATLEVPLSAVCDAPVFRWFAWRLWSEAERWAKLHNAGLAAYRRVHGIRSRNHPVPELVREDDWLEVPFWVWTRQSPQRRRLFVRRAADGVELTDRQEIRRMLRGVPDRVGGAPFDSTVGAQLEELSAEGIRIRPRALVTTAFARLVLGDLFLHGIGGAKYDQLTDWILEQFFGFAPPQFLTVTATVRLPWELPSDPRGEIQQTQAALRRLWHNPEDWIRGHASVVSAAAARSAEEKFLLRCQVGRDATGPERHQRLRELSAALRPFVSEPRQTLGARLAALRQQARARAITRSREFSFCLHPRDTLPPRLLELLTPDGTLWP